MTAGVSLLMKNRVISLVPSWTETLLESGVQVVGRTRYCIHPRSQIEHVPVVGGTKDLDWEKVKKLKADYLLVDKEENLPWMKEDSPVKVIVTEVRSIESMPGELGHLARVLESKALDDLANQWQQVIATPNAIWDWQKVPACLEVLRPFEPPSLERPQKCLYVIWKKPWMAVGQATFIGSVLRKLGAEILDLNRGLYPEFDMGALQGTELGLLFSSEPFPFHKFKDELKQLPHPSFLVDGESYSWFGIRSLRFLQSKL